MSVVVSIAKGADASYPWRQIGTGGADLSGKPGAGYYLSASQKGGEPPGRWVGEGAADLGFHDGEVVDRAPFERLYGQFADPRDQTGQARLGRAPQQFQPVEEIYAGMLAAEPEATAERRAELMYEAKAQVRTPTLYWDTTLSVGKSVSLLHASALVNAVQAAERGDQDEAARWDAVAGEIWECIQVGNRVFIDYLQREAGYTRTGYHGRNADGVETGRWEDAHAMVVAMFPQHTSRDGEPQLHIHNLWLNRVQTESDGRWRAPDGTGFFAHKGAGAALAAFAMESELSRRAGIRWAYRPGSHGREIAGVPESLMKLFSSRRVSISAVTARLAHEFEERHGHAPDQRALRSMRQFANHLTRQAKEEGALDFVALSRQWEAQAQGAEIGALHGLAPRLWHPGTVAAQALGAQPDQAGPAARALTPAEERDVMARGLAQIQETRPLWRLPDLIRCLGEQLPDHAGADSGAQACAVLEGLAARVLSGDAGPYVVCLEAPEWPRVPDCLRRGDGRSVYKRHWTAQYATQAQLTLEERLLAQAREDTAPRLAPDVAAKLLGADQALLEAQLQAQAQQAQQAQGAEPGAGWGLRLDQKAALWHVLTSSRRAEVMVGPAGSGKTVTAAEAARVWRAAGMGQVYGLATSQAARNVLAEAGVGMAENTAQFLGHLKGQREALGARPVPEGSLLILDEASMMSMQDMAAIVRTAAQQGCKVLITGDHEQLTAVEGGGGMMMLTRQMGHVQLAEPVRFDQQWERSATLRLRMGDASVLREYDERARLAGGTYEDVTEQAVHAWMADHLSGKDTLLIAASNADCHELSRRVRDELITAGEVSPGRDIPLRDGARASTGDLIIARENDHRTVVGSPGRTLANGDVLRLDGCDGTWLPVRRYLGRDSQTGQPVWSAPFTVPKMYVFSNCDLAYAVTCHSAQGRTVDTAHALVDGTGGRQDLYVAMSRGRQANYAYCVTSQPRIADVREGSRPAPELARAGRLLREQAALPPGDPRQDGAEPDATVNLDPVTVMAGVLQRDGSALSALETLRQEMSDADHLGVLGAIWYDLARREQTGRFERSLRDCLPAALADEAMDDSARTWLWRSLREAEAAGLDGGALLREVAAARSMDGARDPARVLDSRVRWRLQFTAPQLQGPWSQRVPQTGDPELDQFIGELATAMDARQQRIGEHAAHTTPIWATRALGPVPAGPAARAGWQQRAGMLGAYREMFGYDHPGDAIGPEPAKTAPEARAAWHTAFAALGRVDGIDVRGLTDEQLALRRSTYLRETAWAPRYVADAIRLARKQEKHAREQSARSDYLAAAAARKGNAGLAGAHTQMAASWRAVEAKSGRVRDELTPAHDTRCQWDVMTEPARRMALAADLEMKRRGLIPGGEPLTSAEPDGFSYPQPPAPPREPVWTQGTLDGPAHLPEHAGLPAPVSQDHREELGLQMLGLDLAHIQDELPVQVTEVAAYNRERQQEIDERRSIRVPSEDPDEIDLGYGWHVLAERERDAILQPPKPPVRPAAQVLQRAAPEVARHARVAEAGHEAQPG